METIIIFYVDYKGNTCKKEYFITNYYAKPSILQAIVNYLASELKGFRFLICSKYGCRQFVVDTDYKSIECHSLITLPYCYSSSICIVVPQLVNG